MCLCTPGGGFSSAWWLCALTWGIRLRVTALCRDRGDIHVGTLLRIMPSEECEGGALVVQGRRVTPWRNADCLVFIPLGVRHLVTHVTAGGRWVAKAAVHVPRGGEVVPRPTAARPAGAGSAAASLSPLHVQDELARLRTRRAELDDMLDVYRRRDNVVD